MTSVHAPELVSSLETHNAAFNQLLSLIPSRYYIAQEAEEQADSKWMKNKKRKTGEEIKEHKRRAKQEKLDPSNNKTTAEKLASKDVAHAEDDGPSTSKLTPLPPAASISDLRAKLANKLNGFRSARGIEEGEGMESRDQLERERREKRGEMRDKRRKDRKEERRKGEVTARGAKTQLIVPPLPAPTAPGDTVSYQHTALPSTSGSKPKTALKSLSNPVQALAHLEKHKEKLASLPEEKRKEIEEKERWAKAEERAGGGKVHDEEKSLKKAVKRELKGKAKGSKEWAERKLELQKSQSTAIKKRNDNIASRADARKNKRLGIKDKTKGKAVKKGRPGFEGKNKGGKGKDGKDGGKGKGKEGGGAGGKK
ncbi:hypothetical protein P7C73_g3715, partial [Tremellales sp. Uapishka_1]